MEFLCAAKEKKRSFRVFVAEGAPRYQGHVLAKELVARGLQTTLITDSAVFAMISRVNMVIVGAHAVMANGGVIAPVGLNMVALAAQRHAVPFVVLAGTHKVFYHNNCSCFTITFRRKVKKPILLPANSFHKFDMPWHMCSCRIPSHPNVKKTDKVEVQAAAQALSKDILGKCRLQIFNDELLALALLLIFFCIHDSCALYCMDFGSGNGSPLLHVVNPAFDYVPPKLVSLFITDTGGHNPSYMYRLIADYYSADDLVVQRRPASGN
ncbi:Translation initiation factor eIF-2B subunit beta [Vitis vinifera]|uniref:Translation initiation factor eIF2B subunit beta n=1 Tax=Vitis vinifera TaxID=29760 RepID=A0A438CSB7_VITVI|nr:Translation initiation factor eIF-2B subunit beta [Vitis vinifera]